ncbi:MAG: hypothetical protein AAGC57_12545 [Pseudomonadota bacterium]
MTEPATLRPVRSAQVALALGAMALVLPPWFAGGVPYGHFFDDFYYYLVVVDRWLAVGEMSFFPGVETNGFQPLWFFLLTGLRLVFGESDGAVFGTLTGVILACQLWTAWLLGALVLRVARDPVVAGFAVLAAGYQALRITDSGMEVALIIPLLLVLLLRLDARPVETQTPSALLLTGGLISLICLTRLDAAVLIAVLFAWPLVQRPGAALFLSLGGALFFAYLAWMMLDFGSPLPVSGAAKQLAPFDGPSWRPALILFLMTPEALPLAAPGVVAVLGALAVRSPMRQARACLLAVVVFYAVQATLSDWKLWFWYLYPLVPGIALAVPALLDRAPRVLRVGSSLLLSAIALLFFAGRLDYGPYFRPIIEPLAREVAAYAAAHPGRYAMGDRAGMAAYLADQPVLQLEGLVMDRPYLERIARRDDLVEVLQDYGIERYVTFETLQRDGCWLVIEPARGGPDSPRMRGRFCEPPEHQADIEDGLTFYVFQVPPREP